MEIMDVINGKLPVRVAAAVLCLIVFLTQAITLDYYLVLYKSNNLWWLWTIADAVTLIVLIISFVISFKKDNGNDHSNLPKSFDGELPFGYPVWVVYSAFTAVKVAIIFEGVAMYLDEKSFFGPNVLKIVLLLTGVIFLLLITTHSNVKHDTAEGEKHLAFITSLSHGVLFNIFDTVSILEILIIEESHIFLTFVLHRIINAIGCLNIVVPFIPLLTLSSRSKYSGKEATVHATHAIIYLVCINLPMFIIRLYLWHHLHKDISVFFMKNVLGIWFAIVDIYKSCQKKPTVEKKDVEKDGLKVEKRHKEEEETVM